MWYTSLHLKYSFAIMKPVNSKEHEQTMNLVSLLQDKMSSEDLHCTPSTKSPALLSPTRAFQHLAIIGSALLWVSLTCPMSTCV